MSIVEMEAKLHNKLNPGQIAKLISTMIETATQNRDHIAVGLRYGIRSYRHTTDYDALITVKDDRIYLCIDTGNGIQHSDTVTAVSEGMRQAGVSESLIELT